MQPDTSEHVTQFIIFHSSSKQSPVGGKDKDADQQEGCMCVCCVCVRAHTHVLMHIHVRVHKCVCMQVCMHTWCVMEVD